MDHGQWQQQNGEFLSAALRWLRLQLSAAAAGLANGGAPEAAAASELEEAKEARDRAAGMNPPPALYLMAELLRLTPFERDIVLLCAATEFDTRIPALCGRAMGGLEHVHAYPTFALALSLFESPSWSALAPHRPLRYWRLIDVNPGIGQPFTAAPLRLDERILHYVKGLNSLDPKLAVLATPVDPPPDELPPSQAGRVAAIAELWRSANAAENAPAAMLLGSDRQSKLLVAAAAARQLDRTLYRLDSEALPSNLADVESLARLWQREAALLPLALYVDAQESGNQESQLALDRFLFRARRSDGFVFVGSREPLARVSFPYLPIDIGRPTMEEQRARWESALASRPEDQRAVVARRLATQFSLNTTDIDASAQQAAAAADWPHAVWDQCRDRSRPRLDTLAQRVDPKASWDDLVVGDETLRLLREMTDQARTRGIVYTDWQFGRRLNRGLGIGALFSGESGTGKTMAAEVIARELRCALYKIDLSQVVNKYIGETEKNLQRVFDAMDGSGSILFFDEADALFGKRSEVRDSHDRYANIEVNYLLQRMEAYSGLAILATNMKGAIDQAFLRRLRFVVPFHFPGPPERRQLWQKVFPAATPVEDLDFERLARLNLTGASIHSVAMNAAFLAASNGGRVTMPLVLQAARNEFRKLERPASEAELRV